VSCSEVVEVAFCVTFFSGEVEWVVSDGAEVVSEGQAGVGADQLRDGGGVGVAGSPTDVVLGAYLVLAGPVEDAVVPGADELAVDIGGIGGVGSVAVDLDGLTGGVAEELAGAAGAGFEDQVAFGVVLVGGGLRGGRHGGDSLFGIVSIVLAQAVDEDVHQRGALPKSTNPATLNPNKMMRFEVSSHGPRTKQFQLRCDSLYHWRRSSSSV
jgi:hypothetical protein